MVKLDLVQSSNATLVESQPLVAVFVSGTSNIGMHTVQTLAAAHGKTGKGLRAYIVCPKGQFRFVRAKNLALLKDVDLVCSELIHTERNEANKTGGTPRIDILVMTQATFTPFAPRDETTEGLDTFMSLLYYSRMRFTTRLLPLLLSSSLPAHVISVFGPGRDRSWVPDDLSLRSPENYGFGNSGSHAAYFTTFFMEYLAAQNPGKLALALYYPGMVIFEGYWAPGLPFWFRGLFKYGAPLFRLLPISLDGKESGARTLFNASPRYPPRSADGKAASLEKSVRDIGVAESSDGIVGGGAYRVHYNCEQVATPKQYKEMREEGWLDKIVAHTLKAFEEIEAGRVFTG